MDCCIVTRKEEKKTIFIIHGLNSKHKLNEMDLVNIKLNPNQMQPIRYKRKGFWSSNTALDQPLQLHCRSLLNVQSSVECKLMSVII